MGKRKTIVERTLGGYPVRDATTPTELFVLPVDIKNGVPENPDQCAIAQCARRTMGTDYAVIFKGTAWIKTPTASGYEILRYLIGTSDQKKIASFDETGEMPVGGVRLTPPPRSATLPAQRARNKIDAAKRRCNYDAAGNRYPDATGRNQPRGVLNTRGHHKRPITVAA